MRSPIAVVDFDGTIVQHRFPAIGDPMSYAFVVLKEMKEAGWKLILWTCREDEGHKINRQYLSDAVEFCRQHGVEFDAVNETLKEAEFRPEGVPTRKPYADIHIDDRNLGGFPGWLEVRRICIEEWDFR